LSLERFHWNLLKIKSNYNIHWMILNISKNDFIYAEGVGVIYLKRKRMFTPEDSGVVQNSSTCSSQVTFLDRFRILEITDTIV
jgi:hypothetical protein